MRNDIPSAIAAVVAATMLLAASARAGVVITITNAEPDAGQGRETKAYLEPKQVKMENGGGGVIFHDDAKTFTYYSDREKTYTETSPEALKAMQSQAMAAMQAQMAQLPEAQRKQMEAMLEKQGMGPAKAEPESITYRKTASGQTVGAWRCDQFDELTDGKKVAELCIARLDDLGLTDADLAAFKSLAKVVADSGPRMAHERSARFDFDAMRAQIGFAGMPVRTVDITDDQQRHESIVKTVERLDLPPATFLVPAGYAKRDMMMR